MKNKKLIVLFLFIISVCFVPFSKIQGATLNTNTYGKIHFINVSSHNANADAILLESKGKLCLIDSGNPATYGTGSNKIDYSGYDGAAVAKYIKSIGGTHLDYIIATHSHSDHIGGMKQIVDSGLVNSSTKYYYRKQYGDDPNNINITTDKYNNDPYGMNNEYFYNIAMNSVKKAGASTIDVTNNTNINITLGNFNIKLLNTESWANKGNTTINGRENNNSIVEYVTIGSKKVLLTADMEAVDEKRLINNGSIGKVDLLKLGHHGANTSNSIELLDATRPNGVVVSGDPDYYPPELNATAIKYLTENYVDEVYYTLKSTGAIIAEFTSNSYTLKNSNSSVPITNAKGIFTYQKSGIWTKIIQNNNPNRYAWYIYDDGIPRTGWKKVGNYWYYFHAVSGTMMKGWRGNYYLNPNTNASIPEGAMVTGWLKINNYWYYFNKSDDSDFELGECVTGFRKIGGKWYYFNTSSDGNKCAMNTASSKTIGGRTFKFNSEGECTNFNGLVTKPTSSNYCKAITYNGSSQTITKAASNAFSFSNNSGTNAGSYTVTTTLSSNYLWNDYTSSAVKFNCLISQANISTATVSSISDTPYTGSAITPTPTVKMTLNGTTKTLVKDTDYTLSYTNNKKAGTATVKITGKGNYSSSKSINFNIIDDSLSFINTSNMKVIDNKVYINIPSGNSIDMNTLFSNINNSSTKTLYDNDNNKVTNTQALIATGYVIKTTTSEYPIIVYGDVDGTGTINTNDLAIVYRYISEPGAYQLSDLARAAADIDRTGTINALDLRNIYTKISN